jgi:hypothetical protein
MPIQLNQWKADSEQDFKALHTKFDKPKKPPDPEEKRHEESHRQKGKSRELGLIEEDYPWLQQQYMTCFDEHSCLSSCNAIAGAVDHRHELSGAWVAISWVVVAICVVGTALDAVSWGFVAGGVGVGSCDVAGTSGDSGCNRWCWVLVWGAVHWAGGWCWHM